jgi:DNA replication and repair protein RecF
VFLHHLSLTHFRNYSHAKLELPSSVSLFQGDNGQGKTNLLEAIYFLATTRSLRAGSDREMVNWEAAEEPIPFARVEAGVRRERGDLKVEIVIRADRMSRHGSALEEGGGVVGELSKRIKVNGVAKRALDLVGLINVVVFSPQDLDLIGGAPSGRRRHLDISNCQVDRRYCHALQQYNRVLSQRNHLLKQIREGRQTPETLEFWTEELVKHGGYLLSRRLAGIAALNARIDRYFRRLTGTGKRLRIDYRSTVEEVLGQRQDTEAQGHGDTEAEDVETEEEDRQKEMFRKALRRYQRRETMQGVSLLGPHRDDLVFRADGIDVGVYGSRGEQRAVALALKLAEVDFMQATTGERPILLLDDVMSELDPSRQRLMLATLDLSGQTIITATDLHPFSPDFLADAALFRVEQGRLFPMVYSDEPRYNQGKEA